MTDLAQPHSLNLPRDMWALLEAEAEARLVPVSVLISLILAMHARGQLGALDAIAAQGTSFRLAADRYLST